ncbi:MAG: Ig-like domain-containing protein [Myxococcota bacterium]
MSSQRTCRFNAAAALITAAALSIGCRYSDEPEVLRTENDSRLVLNHLSESQRASMASRAGETRVFLDDQESGPGMSGVRASIDGTKLLVDFGFPLKRDHTYTIHHPALEEALELPGEPREVSEPRVVRVVPDATELPANVLRLYVVFDEPMSSKFKMSEAIEIVDLEDGSIVEAALLDIEQPLFDRSNTRLTVIFNPGRTKRGVGSNIEGGAPLEPNRRYALRVIAGLTDAEGDPIEVAFEHVFHTVEPDRRALEPSVWSVQSPGVGTRDPMVIDSGRWLDPYQAGSRIALLNPHGRVFPLRATSSGQELRFTPQESWAEGCHTLVVSSELEDVSGNRSVRAFDGEGKGTRTPSRRPIPIGDPRACEEQARETGEVDS